MIEGLGKRVELLMTEQGLTQTELAERAGLKLPQINRLIRHNRELRGGALQKTAEALGTSTEYLVTGTENRCRRSTPDGDYLVAYAAIQRSAANWPPEKKKSLITDLLEAI